MIAAGVITGLAAAGLSALLGTTPAAAVPCANPLAQVVHAAGWRGHDARVAWAIAMRESKGQPGVISSTGDVGLFQFNRAAHGGQPWWNTQRLLTAEYNAAVAYQLSQAGRTFYPWDIDGKGRHLGRYTSTTTYQVYVYWYDRHPKACRRG